MFSKTCQYAIQSILYIALHGNETHPVKSKEIAATQEIPLHFLGKIMQDLVKQKILVSIKGPTGGFILGEGKRDMSLLEIVDIVDGLEIFDQCGIGLKKCTDDQPCPIHNEYKIVKARIRALLESRTIDRLTREVNKGNSFVSLVNPPLPKG